jgi:hypothetical protein
MRFGVPVTRPAPWLVGSNAKLTVLVLTLGTAVEELVEEVDAISCKGSHDFVNNACAQFGKADAMCIRAEQGHHERCGSQRRTPPDAEESELLLSESDGVAKTTTLNKKTKDDAPQPSPILATTKHVDANSTLRESGESKMNGIANPPFLSEDSDHCPTGSTQVTEDECLKMGRRASARKYTQRIEDFCNVESCRRTLVKGAWGHVPHGGTARPGRI